MYYTILISIILVIVYYLYINKRKDIPVIQIISIFITPLIILAMREGYTSSNTLSTEYRGSLGVNATYYEYWESWVVKECSREVPCGENCSTDSNGKTTCVTVYCTEYYDCSYCDENSAYWVLGTNTGYSKHISKDYYNTLRNRWNSPQTFKNHNRNILKSHGCGVDGNSYSIKWDNQIESSEPVIDTRNYHNKVKVSNSTYDYKKITGQEAGKLGLYHYPELYNFHYKQKNVLGMDKLKISETEKQKIDKYYQFINGNGEQTKGMVYVLLFPNKDINIASLQENYWYGGNRNEIVICVGYDPTTLKLDWVKVFSWTKDKMVHVELREEIMELGTLDLMKIYEPINKTLKTHYKPRDLKDFDFLEVSYPTWMYIVSLLLSIVIPIGSFFIKIKKY